MNRRSTRILTFLALAGVVSGTVLLVTKTTEPLLLDRATRVADIHPLSSPPRYYGWINEKEAHFSPQGDRIVWSHIEPAHRTPPALAWIHRLVPAFDPPPPLRRASLWVCRLDGTQQHELGYVGLKPDPVEGMIDWNAVFWDISWLPDGKKLSFRHKDGLYTIPVDY